MFALSFSEALAGLRAGRPVIFPTETFFALGCSGLDHGAVRATLQVKGRPPEKPLPLIAGDASLIATVCPGMTPVQEKLAAAFWPGPLSILLQAWPGLPAGVASRDGFVAVRVSPHPAAAALSLAAGCPLAATSANLAGAPPAAAAACLDPILIQACAGFLDTPPGPAGGAPSTLVQTQDNGELTILREGAVASQALQDAGFAIRQKI